MIDLKWLSSARIEFRPIDAEMRFAQLDTIDPHHPESNIACGPGLGVLLAGAFVGFDSTPNNFFEQSIFPLLLPKCTATFILCIHCAGTLEFPPMIWRLLKSDEIKWGTSRPTCSFWSLFEYMQFIFFGYKSLDRMHQHVIIVFINTVYASKFKWFIFQSKSTFLFSLIKSVKEEGKRRKKKSRRRTGVEFTGRDACARPPTIRRSRLLCDARWWMQRTRPAVDTRHRHVCIYHDARDILWQSGQLFFSIHCFVRCFCCNK